MLITGGELPGVFPRVGIVEDVLPSDAGPR